MILKIQNLIEGEWVLLHDFYFESLEPDAPISHFKNLSEQDKKEAVTKYHSTHFKSLYQDDLLIGFVGFFPDDFENINLFYVISPKHRGKGYFSNVLKSSVEYCRTELLGYKNIRVLTRKENQPSIKGLESFSFIKKGWIVEAVQPEVIYEEYLLPI